MENRRKEMDCDLPLEGGTEAASSASLTPLERDFAIVGIGASAGGLEALERFFDHVPAKSGMGFVVVQHLSPDFRSVMDELLARHTEIAIHRVEDNMLVEPDAIYLIPPKKEMIISGGRLLLTDKDPAQGLALPIDIFLRSLAQDQASRAAAVILSGTGSDGSRGVLAVHEAGGLVIAQDEESAKFDGMPKAAVDTGVVDLVLPPDAIPAALADWRQRRQYFLQDGEGSNPPIRGDSVEAIIKLLRSEYGIDFSAYKSNTVSRRIERRLLMNGCQDLDQYVQRLSEDPEELNSLYRDLLIGVTKFFRDQGAFDRLASEVLPRLLSKARPEDEFRIWVAACATGEEAYSLAILVQETLEAMNRKVNVKIFATDVHRASLDAASAGIYPESSLSEVAPRRLERFFVKHGAGYQVSPELRKLIVFACHNVLRDAPFTRLDLVSCRNLLIYFQPPAQKKVLSLFHFGLHAGGVLFLGPSESPAEIADEFDTLDEHWKIFRKRRDVRLPTDLRIPAFSPSQQRFHSVTPVAGGGVLPDVRLMRTYDAILEGIMPPSVLINERREILHTFCGAGKWLVTPDGRPSADILDRVDRDLKPSLAGAIQRATKEMKTVVYAGVPIAREGLRQAKLTVRPIYGGDNDTLCMLISLENMEPRPVPADSENAIDLERVSQEQLLSLEAELRYTKENLQATIEELETSNEELQAANEELVASNEELQSTNEELHSVNEELYTVNAEFQRKILELKEMTDDMDNLLCSTDVGTIFLDREMCIRRFTPQVSEAFQIMQRDIGRPIDSFAYNIDHPALLEDVANTLREGTRVEREVQDRHGKWYLLRVLPYRSKAQIEGVVLTLIDVSLLKQAEKELRLMSKVFMDGADPIIIEDLAGRILDANAEAERSYGWKRRELIGANVDMLVPESCRSICSDLRKRCIQMEQVRNVEIMRCDQSGASHPVLLTMSLLTDEAGQPAAIATIAKDITARKQVEEECRRAASELETANHTLRESIVRRKQAEDEAREAVRRRDHFLAMLSHELRNPLGAILNAIYLMERKEANEATRQEAQAVIIRQARQMGRLLDDLLDVSRITQNKIEIRKELVDLAATAADAVQAARPLIEVRAQKLHVDIDPAPLLVVGDAARLQQIQVNLLHNAAKYTAPEGTIWLSLHRQGNEALLRVRDTGEGIPADMLDHIFELFVQNDNTLDRADGGMGVGLTLVRTLVEKHGGSVTARSEGPGRGSEFVVRLPLSNTAQSVPALSPKVRPPAGTRVLIVEDNAGSREMLAARLRLDGCHVTVAGDGHEGLEAMRRDLFDVALVDIGLPGIDGYEVARQVRAGKEGAGIYLVALTGYGRPEDRQAVLEAGFDEHLVKPVKPDDIDHALGRRRPPR